MVNYNFARFFRGGNVGLGDGVYTPLTTTRAPAVLKSGDLIGCHRSLKNKEADKQR